MALSLRINSDISDSAPGLIIKNNEVIKYKASPGETSVEIPEGITQIDWDAFNDQYHLKYIKLPSTVRKIRPAAFSFCTSLEEIVIPEGVEFLSPGMFCGCFSLKRIRLPSTLKKIGNNAFEMCHSLKSIELPEGLEKIGGSAFDGCSSLQEITVPGGVKIIEDSLFIRCSSLKKIVLSEGIEEICDSAFWHCDALEKIQFPKSLHTIHKTIYHVFSKQVFPAAFYERSENDFIIVGDGILIEYTGRAERIIIPQNVRVIADSAFENNNYIRTVVAFNGLVAIGDNAFSNCSSMLEIRLPESLEYIGNSAFSGCTSLGSIKIPGSIKKINSCVFRQCTSLYRAEIGKGIEEIGNVAFDECTSLKELILPDSLKKIGICAFSGCTSLINADIPDSLSDIDQDAFYNTPWADHKKIVPEYVGCQGREQFLYAVKNAANSSCFLPKDDWHNTIMCDIDERNKESAKLSQSTITSINDQYPDIELIEVTDHYGNDRSEDMSSSYIYKNTKGFKGIITEVTKDKRMFILYPDRSIKIHTSPVKEHTVCTMSDGSIVHTVVTKNSIYRFKENKKEPGSDKKEKA